MARTRGWFRISLVSCIRPFLPLPVLLTLVLWLALQSAFAQPALSASNYPVDSGDRVEIRVYGEPDLSVDVRLSDAGTVIYPFLGELRLAGKTIGQVERMITEGLKGDYLVDSRVTVTVVEYRQFYVRGEVKSPGGYPYQPGLSFYSAPTAYHDPASGRLALRSSWDGDAHWFYHAPDLMQTFEDGRIVRLDWSDLPARNALGESVVVPLRNTGRFEVSEQDFRRYFLIGLEPHRRYDVEVDDEGLAEHTADAAGIIVLEFPAGRVAGVRLHPTEAVAPRPAAEAAVVRP